jgi:hypothetical protein
MASGVLDEVDFAYNVRQTVNGLHRDLAKLVVWRDVLPYTPLPMHGLQLLQRQIGRSWDNGHFSDLIDSIIDIQGWLSLPPRSRGLDFPTDVRESARQAMQEETEENIRKINGRPPLSEAEQLRKQLEEFRRRDEARRRIEETEREQAKQRVEVDKKAAARQAAQDAMKIKDAADREKKLQEKLNRLAEEARVLKAAKEATEVENEKLKAVAAVFKSQEVLPAALLNSQQRGTQQELDQNELQSEQHGKMDANSTPFNTNLHSSLGSYATGDPASFVPQATFVSQASLAPPASFNTSFGPSMSSNTTTNNNLFKTNVNAAIPAALPEEMEDIISYHNPPTTTFGSHTPNPMQQSFGVQGSHNVALHAQVSGEKFKEACRRLKQFGKCTIKGCRFPHAPCEWWIKKGTCRYGERCKNSHDPFFRNGNNVASQPGQASTPDLMIVDSNIPRARKHKAPKNAPIPPSQYTSSLAPFPPYTTPPPYYQSLPLPTGLRGPNTDTFTSTYQPFSSHPSMGHNTIPPLPPPSAPLLDRSTKNGKPLRTFTQPPVSHRGHGATKSQDADNQSSNLHGSSHPTAFPTPSPFINHTPSSNAQIDHDKYLDDILALKARPQAARQNKPSGREAKAGFHVSRPQLSNDPLESLDGILELGRGGKQGNRGRHSWG